MDDNAGHEPEPITPELLADLQAGLLDDATAAALRQRVRTDSAAAGMLSALDRVRRDLADLGADQGTAPDVPAEVTARVGAALQAAPPHRPGGQPAHSVRHTPRWQRVALVSGVGAAVVGAVVGGVMLVREPALTRSLGPTAKSITVSRPRPTFRCRIHRSSACSRTVLTTGRSRTRSSVRPVCPGWATRRRRRCLARDRSTCTGGPRC